MPPKRTYKKRTYKKYTPKRKYTAKKKFGKKFSRKGSKISYGGIPDSKFLKLKYVDIAPKATAGAGALTMDVRYRLNSPYDPNYSTGTGQISAQMFLTWSQFYQQYQVYGAKIVQQCWNYDPVTPVQFHSVMSNQVPNWLVGQDRRVLEMNRWVQTKTASPLGSGRNVVTFVRYVKLRKLAGVTKSQFQGGAFASIWNSNPVDQMFTVVCSDPLDATDDNGAPYQVKTTIVFYVKFFDRNPIATTLQVDTAAEPGPTDVDTLVADLNQLDLTPTPI